MRMEEIENKMSILKSEVVPIKLIPHKNSDNLSIVRVKGWQVVVKTGDFEGTDLGAYIPIDSVLPQTEEWEFLKQHKYRVKTIKLRGMISQGMLIPAREGWVEGQDVTEELKVQKYEPPVPTFLKGGMVKDVPNFPKYTDIERWKNHPDIFKSGDEVVITEKIHGINFRCGIINDVFCVGSHKTCRDPKSGNIYSSIADSFGLEDRLRKAREIVGCKDIVYFGEIYGKSIQDLRYDIQHPSVRCFDIWVQGDLEHEYLDHSRWAYLCSVLKLDTVPILGGGKFDVKLLELAEGQSSIAGHLKEGIVIKSKYSEFHPEIGRKVLKRLSETYELRKEKKKRKKHGLDDIPTEHH